MLVSLTTKRVVLTWLNCAIYFKVPHAQASSHKLPNMRVKTLLLRLLNHCGVVFTNNPQEADNVNYAHKISNELPL